VEGEDWKSRLGTLIAEADTVIFIISPEALKSPICRWEVDEAARLSKRILPVLWLAPGDAPTPERLASLNYTRFDEGRSYVMGLRALIAALNTDLEWLREHTRLLARAMEWESGGRPENRLMSGKDIEDAKVWVANRPRNAPEATALHLDFINASEIAETARNDAARQQLEEIASAQTAREKALQIAEAAQQRTTSWQARIAWLLGAAAILVLVLLSNPSTANWFVSNVSANIGPLLSIAIINLLLAGDDAVVVGSTAASVASELRAKVIFWGVAGAVFVRVALASAVLHLLALIGITLAGGFVFLSVTWSTYRKVVGRSANASHGPEIQSARGGAAERRSIAFWPALRSIIFADFAASSATVLAVAGAAQGSILVLYIGLAVSVALMALASNTITRLLRRYPSIAWIGLLVMLWVAIEMIYEGSHEVTCQAFGFGCSEDLWHGILHRLGLAL